MKLVPKQVCYTVTRCVPVVVCKQVPVQVCCPMPTCCEAPATCARPVAATSLSDVCLPTTGGRLGLANAAAEPLHKVRPPSFLGWRREKGTDYVAAIGYRQLGQSEKILFGNSLVLSNSNAIDCINFGHEDAYSSAPGDPVVLPAAWPISNGWPTGPRRPRSTTAMPIASGPPMWPRSSIPRPEFPERNDRKLRLMSQVTTQRTSVGKMGNWFFRLPEGASRLKENAF